jgi:transcriptional regulator with XRE-family HTH domain
VTLKTGSELRAWRLRNGIKQKALARVLGVTPRALQLVEKDDRRLRVVWQWAIEGIVRHVEGHEVPPAFMCGDYVEGAATRRTDTSE